MRSGAEEVSIEVHIVKGIREGGTFGSFSTLGTLKDAMVAIFLFADAERVVLLATRRDVASLYGAPDESCVTERRYIVVAEFQLRSWQACRCCVFSLPFSARGVILDMERELV